MTKRQMLRYATAIETALEAAMKGKALNPCPVCVVSGSSEDLPPFICPPCPLHSLRLGFHCETVRDRIAYGDPTRPTYIRKVRGIIRKLRAGTWKP